MAYDEKQVWTPIGMSSKGSKGIKLLEDAKYTPDPPADQWQEINTTNYRKQFTASPVLYWGSNNDYPQQIAKAMKKCDTLLAALHITKGIYLGKGLYMYQEDYQSGREIVERVMPAEIEDAFYASNIDEYLDFAIQEMNTWGQIFPVWKLSRARKIAQLRLYPTVFNRLERPDWQTGQIENVYISAQWGINNFVVSSPQIPKTMAEWVSKYPLISNFNPVKSLKDTPGYTFVQHIKNVVSGEHYGTVPWHGAYENGWVEMSSKVPEMKSKIYENLLSLAQIVYIDTEYLETTYPGFAGYEAPMKKEIFKQMQKDIDENLVGADNQGKTMFSLKSTDVNGKTIYKIEFKPVDSPFKDGNLLVDVQMADFHILSSVMLDPSLMGAIVPGGGKQSAGSGSNIREALMATISRADMVRKKALSPLQTWSRYAGWDDTYASRTKGKDNKLGPLKFGIRDVVIPTQSGSTMNSVQEVTQ